MEIKKEVKSTVREGRKRIEDEDWEKRGVKNKITRKRWKIGVQDTDTSQNVCVVSTPAELKKTTTT